MYHLQPIGEIHSPYTSESGMPLQAKFAQDVTGYVTVYDEYVSGLRDVDGFSHLYLFYVFHQAKKTELSVIPFIDTQERGVFATRSPLRPNHIGMSIVNLDRIEGNTLHISGVDILDGTPLVDIKPYIKQFDIVEASRSGWIRASEKEIRKKTSDDRFV